MILLSLKQGRQQERRGWQQPPVRRKMIAKEWIGGTQQSTSDAEGMEVGMWECEEIGWQLPMAASAR
jgi:hypothetical protein